MKTTIKQKIKSSYQAILDYFSWLLADDKKKDSIYENDEDVVEQELSAFVPNQINEPLSEATLILTKKQEIIFELIPNGQWVSSTYVGNEYCAKVYAGNIKNGRSQYASKTLNQLVKIGIVEKNNKRQYKKR
jgi:hypothetical protein